MASFDFIGGFGLKEILEIATALVSFAVFYISYKKLSLFKKKSANYNAAILAIIGFFSFFVSMTFEVLDSYFDVIIDEFQIYAGIIAIIFLFLGFTRLFRREENA